MLLEFIARYYKLLWFALGAIAFLKIILAFLFHGNLEGMNGVIYALFKWYGDEEQEMEDHSPRRMMMRIHNIVTMLLYFAIFIMIIATFLPMFLGH